MELRRCTPEEWELLKVTLIFKRKNHFDQSTSMTFNSSVSVLCSLCHGYKGIWDATFFSLSLSLSAYVYATHVWVFLVSKACFVLFSIIHCGKLSVLYTLLAVSPASAPLPTPQQSLISIWGSGVPEMMILLPLPDLVTILLQSLAFDCSFSHSE